MTAIALVPFGTEHLEEALAPMLEDPDVRRHTFVPDPPQAGFARRWLDRYEAGRRDGTREGFAVVDGDGTLLGLALAPRIEREGCRSSSATSSHRRPAGAASPRRRSGS